MVTHRRIRRTKRKAHHGRKTKRQHSRNRRGGMFKQFKSFLKGKPSSSVGSEVGSEPVSESGSERVSMNDAIKLKRTSVVGRMDVQFYGVMHVLTLDKPLVINIPADPKSRQNPLTKLIFTVRGNDITVDFVLKKDVFSYCAMAGHDEQNSYNPSLTRELNYEVPSITKSLFLSGFFSAMEIGVGDQIIPIMDNIQRYANECAMDAERMHLTRKYYEGNVRAAHINDKNKAAILKMFPPSSLSSQMAALSVRD